MTFKIRRLEARDKVAWLQLFKGYITFYKATVADDIIETTWLRMIAQEADFHLGFVAVDDADTPIGLAHVLFHRSTWSPTHYCYLEDLFVEPGLRAKGVGRALIDAVYKEADTRQCTRTYWSTEDGNHRARRLYDQMATKSAFVQYRR